jgi:uncharacterized protein (TIGR02594 family)
MIPRWLRSAQADLEAGVREIPGPAAHPRILEWFAACGQASWAKSDEIANCAAFVGAHLVAAGIPLPKLPLRARSYLEVGAPLPIDRLEHLPEGAILVFSRGAGPQPGPDVLDAPGHTGFFCGLAAPGRVLCLGANQGDELCVAIYPATRLLGARWPTAAWYAAAKNPGNPKIRTI